MLTLTTDQQNAYDAINKFLVDPIETVFVLSGYSGTGKSTLVKHIIDGLPNLMKTIRLIDPTYKGYEVELTATTNKAAENFAQISGMEAKTIHSYLGLRVQTDYKTQVTNLIPSSSERKEGKLLFIDEVSYMDKQLLNWVFKLTHNCKIIFIGDPAQLTPVKAQGTPVFDANFSGAMLSQVVRQAEGNPIVELSAKFRETVNTGEFFQFTPDGTHVKYMDRDSFNQAIDAEFTRSDWKYKDSKILAWTNARVISFNNHVSANVTGSPEFQVGDYAVCNSYVTSGRKSIKTDQLVCITKVSEPTVIHGVSGRNLQLDYIHSFFFPDSLQAKNELIKQARKAEQYHIVETAESKWIDLRAAYAQTVNKAQGSTYDQVFIDLDDIGRCNSGDQIARMLYVAASRARYQVTFTGDLV